MCANYLSGNLNIPTHNHILLSKSHCESSLKITSCRGSLRLWYSVQFLIKSFFDGRIVQLFIRQFWSSTYLSITCSQLIKFFSSFQVLFPTTQATTTALSTTWLTSDILINNTFVLTESNYAACLGNGCVRNRLKCLRRIHWSHVANAFPCRIKCWHWEDKLWSVFPFRSLFQIIFCDQHEKFINRLATVDLVV